ncbi:hypothetical protein [Catenulispora sp. EB89]|uniref:hypothetical protein n=1 Tax=Catenulispora sp. EB89 TaxID=3156257 RepID=UPI003513C893
MSVQRGDLVAGRYRTGEPLGPAWRAHDETGDGSEVLLVPITPPGEDAGADDAPGPLDTDRWRNRPGTPPVTATATGDAGAWLVTKPVAARTLTEAVAQWGALPAEQVLLIAAGATTALAANGPRISATPDHILLTDEGQVLLLPIETTENDLPTLGAALFLAAEGRPASEGTTGTPRQPQLTTLITGLTQPEGDRASTLDRTFAELSRLGAPLTSAHGADTLHEAQAASAAAADAEASEVPTQTMSAAELLAETGESEVAVEADDDEVPTQTMSAAELLAETSESEVAVEADDDDADATHVSEIESPGEVPAPEAETTSLDPLAADAEAPGAADEVPAAEAETASLESPSDEIPATETDTASLESAADTDETATRQVPLVGADAIPTAEAETSNLESPADETATRQVPLIAAAAAAEALASDTDSTATRQVPTLDLESAADAIPTDSTEEIPSPDDSATKALPIPAAESSPNPFVAPTQVADAVPLPGPPQQPIPPGAPMAPAVPPTQAADAVPPPGAPNPWLQAPQPQPQPMPQGGPAPQFQPQQGPWQQGAPGPQPVPPGPWGPGPGQPPYPPGQQPYFPQQGAPAGKGNGGKTAAIIVAAVVAVAAVVSLVVVVTRGNNGSSDTINNAANSSTSGATSGPTSVPGTNFPTGSTSGSDDSAPTDTASDTSSDATDTDTASTSDSPPELTSTPFDPTVLNAFQTDKTPLDVNSLVPQDFTDDKGVHYSLKAGSVQPCVQTDMSNNMQDILTSNSCSKEIAAAYVDDSGQYLISVKVLPLPDQHTATTVYNDLAQQSAADFGIWCPESGPGSSACQGDYQSATIKQYREQQHRYIILSVALAVNHSQSTEITPWLDAAAKKAVDSAGPLNWSGNQ